MLKSLTLNAYQVAARRTDDKNSFANDRERLACWGLGVAVERAALRLQGPASRHAFVPKLGRGEAILCGVCGQDHEACTLRASHVRARKRVDQKANAFRGRGASSRRRSPNRATRPSVGERVYRCGQADERHEHYSNVAREVCKEERARYVPPPLVGKRQEA